MIIGLHWREEGLISQSLVSSVQFVQSLTLQQRALDLVATSHHQLLEEEETTISQGPTAK